MDNKQYNGWANYATWRVQLEVFSDWVNYELSENKKDSEIVNLSIGELAEHMKDYLEEMIESDSGSELATSYALAFLSDVDWYELANSAKESVSEY